MKQVAAFCLFLSFIALASAQKKVVCYVPEYSLGVVNSYDGSVCTHAIYSFALTSIDGVVSADASKMQQFVSMKTKNPNLKLLVAVGGAGWAPTQSLSTVANNAGLRTTFANNILSFINTWNLDGLDVDLEFPTDKNNFLLLLQKLRSVLGTSKILSLAVAPCANQADISYSPAAIADTVDFINMMDYDLKGTWNGGAGIHSALYDSGSIYNVDTCVSYWVNKVTDKNKLILGIPLYGRSFTLTNPANNGINAPIIGVGNSYAGTPKYNEICKLTGYTKVWSEQQKSTYAYINDQWIGFEDLKSVAAKALYINERKLGGAMFWELSQDDYLNECGDGKFPLVNKVQSLLLGGSNPSATSSPTAAPKTSAPTASSKTTKTSAPTAAPTKAPSNAPGTCSAAQNGKYLKDTSSCFKYFWCVNGIQYSMGCAGGTCFNANTGTCDYCTNVSC